MEVGQRLTGSCGPGVRHADQVQGGSLALPVAQRPVDHGRFLGQRQRLLVPAGLLADRAELQACPGDPGRVGQVAAGLQGHGVGCDGVVPVRADVDEVGQHMGQVGARALPLVPARVLRGLEHAAPFGFQPVRRVVRGAHGWLHGRPLGDQHPPPAPERVQHPVGPVRRVQVVVEEPADRLPPLALRVVPHRADRRVPADQVVEAVLAARRPRQQVVVEQGDQRLLGLGERAVAERGRRVQADVRARADPEPPEEPLVVRFQRPVGQVEGGHDLRAGRAGAA